MTAGPRIVLGMTLHNNAAHLREATESLLSQTCGDFVLLMLDDASPLVRDAATWAQAHLKKERTLD